MGADSIKVKGRVEALKVAVLELFVAVKIGRSGQRGRRRDWHERLSRIRVIRFADKVEAHYRFRGRLYTAWYYPDIPLPIGPWKLQGLPGIILEAYDAEAFFHAVFQAVGPASEVPAAGTAAFGPARGIDLDGFRELQAEMTAELIRRIRSKLPRGAQLTVDETYADFLERSFEQP